VGREGYKFRVEGDGAVLSVAIYNVLIEIFDIFFRQSFEYLT
jgi:hypothetical protein